MALREIKGQESAILLLKKNLAMGRVSHAYLFHGPDCVGKELAAKNFAKLLNCSSPTGDDACDFCENCTRIEKGIHPDVIWLRPLGPARVIPIEEVRNFQKAVSLKPHAGKWKVGIFVDAHTLNSIKQDAGNALLKTLEEPPAHTILILVTARPEILLPTIVSRCQAVRFTPLSEDALKEILLKDYDLSNRDAADVSRLSGGRLGAAVKAMREDRMSLVKDITGALVKVEKGYWNTVAGLVNSIENSIARSEESLEWQLAERGLRPQGQGEDNDAGEVEKRIQGFVTGEARRRREEVLGEFLSWYRDLMVWKLTGREDLLIGAAMLEEVARGASAINYNQLERAVRLIEEALHSLRSNSDFHNVMENLLVQLATL